MYINTGATNTLITGNTITRGSLRGTLLRAGGTVTNNFYDQNAVAIQVGNTASTVTGNVILEGVDQPSLASGVGIDVAFSIPKVDIEDNIIAHDESAYTYNLSGINLNGGTHMATVLEQYRLRLATHVDRERLRQWQHNPGQHARGFRWLPPGHRL